jgi:ABC-type glycerol-3-phosphate transport system substrate-binding protein
MKKSRLLAIFMVVVLCFAAFAPVSTVSAVISTKYNLVFSGEYLKGIPAGVLVSDFVSSMYEETTVTFPDDEKKYVATGCTVTIGKDSYTAIVCGDVDGSGVVNSTDILKVKSHCIGSDTLEDAYMIAADADGDGKIGSTDSLRVKGHFVGYYNLFEDSYVSDDSFDSDSEDLKKGEKISYADLEKKDLNGREFYIIERWFGYGRGTIDFTGEVLYMEDYEGNLNNVNKAKKDIIDQVQKDYNCTITGEIFGEGSTAIVSDLRELIANSVYSGAGNYDFFFESYYYYTSFISSGALVNVKDIDTINLKSSCWDQNAVSELSIYNELYFLTGDINTYDNDGTVAMLFNKDFYEELGYNENLYDLVKDKEWTFDKLVELSKQFDNIDHNDDGERNEFDNWFMGSEQANLYRHCVAAGESICTKDENDIPKLTMTTEGTINALTDAVNFYNSGSVLVASIDKYSNKYPNHIERIERTITNAFLEGRELFYMTTLNQIPYIRHMEDEFGILPLPLYSSSQDEYSTSMSAHSSSDLMIPNTSKSDDDLGLVIQALAELSEEKLTPAYYEKQLKLRIFKEEESAEMLDIIFNNRHYDLGEVFGNSWNKPDELYQILDTAILPRFKAQEAVIKNLIYSTMEDIQDRIDRY